MESLSDIVKSISDRVDMSRLEERQRQVLSHPEVQKLLDRYPQISEPAALRAIHELPHRQGQPVADPIRGGDEFDPLVERCLA